jgi:hypothetical protein
MQVKKRMVRIELSEHEASELLRQLRRLEGEFENLDSSAIWWSMTEVTELAEKLQEAASD